MLWYLCWKFLIPFSHNEPERMNLSHTFRTFIEKLADTSGEIILSYYGDPETLVEQKADESPVTIADRKAEEVMRDMIHRSYPDHGIVGEEFEDHRKDAEYVWVLDPIDGTKSFASACPLFGTLIALLHKGQPVLGAVHLPVLKQLIIGDGSVTELNGTPIGIRDTNNLKEAILLVTDIVAVEKHRESSGFQKLMRSVKFVRTWGDCYGYVLLSSGWSHIMIDPVMHTWDLQALIPVVRGAGGIVTSWDGENPVHADSLVAAVPGLHDQVIHMLLGR
jgi:histidinol phosphatase-like enzyme (inositol monophosphatase family)